MGEGKGFLGRLFSSKETVEPVPALTDDEKDARAMSRRAFLKGAAATGLVAAVGLSSEAEAAPPTPDISREERERGERFVQMTIETLRQAIDKASISISRERNQQTLAEQDGLRRNVLATRDREGSWLRQSVVYATSTAYTYHLPDELTTLITLAEEADILGLVLEGLRRNGHLMRGIVVSPKTDYFTIRAADYLPETLGDLNSGEIDPRLFFADAENNRTINNRPAWVSWMRELDFSDYLSDQKVRTMLQDTNCTLAEAYSLIKACIKHPVARNGKHPRSEVMSWMIRQREQFMQVKLLAQTTESFIHFSFPDRKAKFDGDVLDELGATLIKDTKKVERVDSPEFSYMFDSAGGSSPHKFTRQEKLDAVKAVRERLVNSIGQSTGDTTVYFNTHGFESKVVLAPKWEPGVSLADVSLGFDELASAVVDRLKKEGPLALRNLTFVFDQCHSYIFSFRLVQAIGKKARKEGVPIHAYPTMITGAQEGSLAYSAVLNGGLRQNEKAIMREGQLTGEFVARRLQAKGYGFADIAFLVGWDTSVIEIGQQDALPDEEKTQMAA